MPRQTPSNADLIATAKVLEQLAKRQTVAEVRDRLEEAAGLVLDELTAREARYVAARRARSTRS